MKPEKLELQSADGCQLNIDALYQIAPSCFTEAKGADGKTRRVVNFDVLRQLLGDAAADTGDEFYQFTWPGKAEARREAARPIKKTLRPVIEDSVDWDTTQNLYIEGDNLEVLKLLQKSYLGKVKMIYIDPPYNTGNDFVYDDDFSLSANEYAEASGDVDELGNRYRRNTDSNGRFHSDWCSMIYPRLQIARTLLAEDGVIFISMDDNEIQNLTKICNEVFGERNFVGTIIWERAFAPKNDAKYLSDSHDYALVYANCLDNFIIGLLPRTEEANSRYKNPDNDPRGPWTPDNMTVKTYSASYDYSITTPNGSVMTPPNGRCWFTSKERMQNLIAEGRVWFGENGGNMPRLKRYLADVQQGMTATTIWKYTEVGHNQEGRQELKKLFDDKGYFDGPKPLRLLNRILQIANTDKQSIILDFFSGSATTAHAVMQLNAEDGGKRRFIMVQLPEETEANSEARKAGYANICEIGKERIRRAGKKIKQELKAHSIAIEAGSQARFALGDDCDKPTSLWSELYNDEQKAEIQGEAEEINKRGQDLDIGFRVFRVDESNMEDVYFAPKSYSQDKLDMFLDNVKADRTDLDLLFGAMLDWGVQLSLPMSTKKVKSEKLKVEIPVYVVNDGDLVACFAEDITEEVIEFIADQSPLRVLLRDSCFSSDADKINIFEQFKQRLGWSDEEAYKNIRVI